jgi:hypothetical protein
MSAWHAVADSEALRWIVKRGPTRSLFRSEAYQRTNIARHRYLSSRGLRAEPTRFADVHTFCCFVGHNKSGGSMLSGLLDAHPDVIVSDERDALRYVDAGGFSRDQIFWLLDRGLEPYSYAVPGQSQGRSVRPRVVGDSTTGTTTRRLGSDPSLLLRLWTTMQGVEVRMLHAIRNPFDPIAVMMVRGNRSFRNAIDHYFRACDTLVELEERLDPSCLFRIRHETFVRDPATSLSQICGFLGVDPMPSYLQACASIIRDEPDRSRTMVSWNDRWIGEVQTLMASFDFLEGYSYDD